MAGIGPIRQDWEPVVVRKRAPNAAANKDEKAVNAARRSGAEIDTTKKYNAGTNKAASSGTSLNTKRLDDDTENLAHERVSSDLKKNLMQARLDKKMTQAQLAQMNRRKQPDRKARPKKRPRSAANSEQVKRPRIQVEQAPAWSPQLKQLSLTRTVSSSVSSSETGQPRMKNFLTFPWPKKKRSYSRPKKPVAYWSDDSAGLHTLSEYALSMEGSDTEATVEPQKKNKNPRKNNNAHHRWVEEEVKLLLQLFDSDEAVRKYHSGKITFRRFVADQINLQLGHDDGYVDLDAESIKDKMKVIHRIHSYGNPKGRVSRFMMEIVELYRDRIDLVCNTNSSSALSRSDAPSSSASMQGQGPREVSHVGAIRYLRRHGIFDIQELRRYSIVLGDVHNRVLFAACDSFDERKQFLDEVIELTSANQPRL